MEGGSVSLFALAVRFSHGHCCGHGRSMVCEEQSALMPATVWTLLSPSHPPLGWRTMRACGCCHLGFSPRSMGACGYSDMWHHSHLHSLVSLAEFVFCFSSATNAAVSSSVLKVAKGGVGVFVEGEGTKLASKSLGSLISFT